MLATTEDATQSRIQPLPAITSHHLALLLCSRYPRSYRFHELRRDAAGATVVACLMQLAYRKLRVHSNFPGVGRMPEVARARSITVSSALYVNRSMSPAVNNERHSANPDRPVRLLVGISQQRHHETAYATADSASVSVGKLRAQRLRKLSHIIFR